MKTLSFRAFEDTKNNGYNTCNRSSDSRPLLVNCAGSFETEALFETKNSTGRDDYYLMLMLDGELNFANAKKLLTCKKGSLILFEPHMAYRYAHSESKSVNYLWVHFTGSYVKETLKECGISAFPAIEHIAIDDRLIMRYQNLFDAFTTFEKLRERELSVLFDRLLLSLAKRIHKIDESSHVRLSKSLSYIATNYNNKIMVPELAAIEGMSVSRYNDVFKDSIGSSPVDYITKFRITCAAEYLIGTDMSVSEIAYAVGYSSFHYFSKMFKAYTGVSPTEFRNGTKQ